MTTVRLGARIRALRKQQGYTLKELSEITKISPTFICDIERGRSNPSLKRLNDIALALDTTTTYLMGEEDKTPVVLIEEDIKNIDELTNDFLKDLKGAVTDNGQVIDEEDLKRFEEAVRGGLEYTKIITKLKKK